VIGNVSTVANSYIALSAKRVAEMATWIGEDETAARYKNISDTILTSLRERLYDPQAGSFSDGLDGATKDDLAPIAHRSMQATLFPMMAGVLNETAVPGMGKAMVGFLEKTGLKCSCMATFWLLNGLYDTAVHTAEAADHALAILTSDGQFSWLNMIAQGATCTMETWPSGTAPGSGGTGGTWSHPWCASPNSVIVRMLLGVRPVALGWSRFSFTPQISSLRTINATVPIVVSPSPVPVPNGGSAATSFPAEVAVQLQQSASALTADLVVPPGTSARVCLPAPHAMPDPSQARTLTLDGKAVAAASVQAEGRMLCFKDDVPAGKHSVSRL
jgi:hypothetical protein